MLLGAGACSVSWGADQSFSEVERGHYLTDAGDCVACHTADKGKPMAGGRPVETPFGAIYSPNLTPDRETGIGAWSDDDFYRAMHLGIDREGKRLYPAFPYPYFTKLTRADVTAIRAYLNTLPPVKNERPANKLTWPLNYRVFMRGWDWMFFEPGTYEPDPSKSEEWNRGAYLVEGAGHCGACHTPKNIAGASKDDEQLTGGRLQHWFAPELTNDSRNGLGGWNVDDIVEYLKTGRNRHSGATGLMAEVVTNSTSKLRDDDLRAIAVYLKSVTGDQAQDFSKPEQPMIRAGAAIYADSCSACHQSDGTGVPRMFPPLAHNANVQSKDPTSVVRVILEGAQTVPTDARPTPSTMPAFDWKLSDEQIAAVATYVRTNWGNNAPPVSADKVKSLRKALHAGH
jgi:mono/diheme cytochrome c family protein